MFVLDCSVALSWCLPDEVDDYADKALDLLTHQQAMVPGVWHLEIMNVLLVAQRKGRINAKDTALILQTLARLPVQTDKREMSMTNKDLLALAHRHQLSSYDASYLYLAQREQVPLATLDKKLQQVAHDLDLFLHA